jgi:hypothetical protein
MSSNGSPPLNCCYAPRIDMDSRSSERKTRPKTKKRRSASSAASKKVAKRLASK